MLTIDHTHLSILKMTMKTLKLITLNEAKLVQQGTPLKSVPVLLSALVDSYTVECDPEQLRCRLAAL